MHNPQKYMKKSHIQAIKLQQSPEKIVNNQLNNSSAKYQYSFSKSNRFSLDLKMQSFNNRNNQLKQKRQISTAYSNKSQKRKKYCQTPGPTSYIIKSQFDKKPSQGISISPGRQLIKANSYYYKSKNPAPNSYEIKVQKDLPSYTMRDRIENLSAKWLKSIPAPGEYEQFQIIGKQAKTVRKNFQSQKMYRISSGKSIKHEIASYQVQNQFFTSKFDNKGGYRFGVDKRKPLDQRQKKNPGPGAYTIFSEFLN